MAENRRVIYNSTGTRRGRRADGHAIDILVPDDIVVPANAAE